MVSTKTNTIKLSLAVILFISLTSFAQTSTIVFHLPERSGYQSDFSFFDESRNEYVRSWSLRNSGTYIETYDVGTGQLKRVEYFDEIPFIHSFIKISEGEYITYDANDRVYYTIKESKVTGQVSEPVNSMILGAFEKYVTSMQFNPIFLYQDKVAHVNSFLRLYKPYHVDNRHQEEGLIQLTDLKNKSVTDLLPLPKVLDSMDFGELNRFSSVIKGKQLIIAPSYSNEIIIVDLKSLNYIYPIVTKNEFYQITTPYENMRKRQADDEDFFAGMSRHYAHNSYYSGILYDKYRNVYYRILMSPNKGDRNYSMKIVVLDEFFRFQKAFSLPEYYRTNGMFVNASGLNIFNHDRYREDTDKLTFDTFVF